MTAKDTSKEQYANSQGTLLNFQKREGRIRQLAELQRLDGVPLLPASNIHSLPDGG
jgi:hypothetical protein